LIRVENIVKRFGPHLAVDDVSFSVGRGEVVGLLGPNGAGKTTTIRMITGFLPPTSGKAFVAGHDVSEEPVQAKRQVGYLPENAPLYPEMRVVDFLGFMAQVKGLPRRERKARVEQVVDELGLQPVLRRLIANCSLGYKHRVGLAQALLGDPPVVILDEPTTGLDPRQRLEVRDLIKNLSGDRTVILSSHILPEVQDTCQRVMIINKGRLVAEDTPDGLASRLHGRTRVLLRARSELGAMRRLVEKLPGVEVVTAQEGRPTGGEQGEAGDRVVSSITVETDSAPAARESIFSAFAGASLPLLEMSSQGSLEEVFLQLTTEGVSPAVDDGADVPLEQTEQGVTTDA